MELFWLFGEVVLRVVQQMETLDPNVTETDGCLQGDALMRNLFFHPEIFEFKWRRKYRTVTTEPGIPSLIRRYDACEEDSCLVFHRSLLVTLSSVLCSFSPTDNKFATCSDDGTVRIWDFLRCHEERILRGDPPSRPHHQ